MADSYDCTSFSGSDYDSDSSGSFGYSSDEGDYSSSTGSSMSSSLTTPHSRKAASVAKKTHANLDSVIKEDLERYVVKGADFNDFLDFVYGLSADDVLYIENKDWTLDATSLAAYEAAASENDMYVPLKAMFDDFFGIMQVDDYEIDVIVLALGATHLNSTYSDTSRKPDGLFVSKNIPDPQSPSWRFCKAYIEVEKKTPKPFVTVAKDSAPGPSASSSKLPSKPSASNGGHRSRTSKHASRRQKTSRALVLPSKGVTSTADDDSDDEDDDDDATDVFVSKTLISATPSAQTGSSKSSGKRRRVVLQDNPRKRRQLETKETQAACYALECLSANPRRWATGILVQGLQITVQYFDRCGAIFSMPFNFKAEPKKLARLLLAIGKASLQQLGFEPLVVPCGASSITEPLPTLEGAELLVPPPPPPARKDTTQKINFIEGPIVLDEDTWSRFHISHEPLYVYCGLNGRGSVVLPGRFEEKNLDQSSSKGKGKASHDLVGDGSGDVAKLSWPDVGRKQHESDIVKGLRECIPFMQDHLPEVLASASIPLDLTGLPRAYFIEKATGALKDQYSMGLRHFTIMISRRYEHLWELTSLDEFKTVYVDIVECHHYAYKFGFVLHRDLSEHNLMFTRRNGAARGLVNDWDLSSEYNTPTDSDTSRTGTGPFMALDFLEANYKDGHMYHHDAESLYYILIWAALHYNLSKSKPRTKRTNRLLVPWTDVYFTARHIKRGLLLSESDRDTLYDETRKAFKPLRDTWLAALWELFHESFMSHYGKKQRKNDVITFDRFMEALGCKPRELPEAFRDA